MAQQVSGIPFTPIATAGGGYSSYVGAAAVKTWVQATAGQGRSVSTARGGSQTTAHGCKSVKFSVVGGEINVLTDGTTPDVNIGVRYGATPAPHIIENSVAELDAWKMYIPVGVTVYAEFGN
jgi:hypothetical protein